MHPSIDPFLSLIRLGVGHSLTAAVKDVDWAKMEVFAAQHGLLLLKSGRVFKVNGSATFADLEMVSMIRDYDKTSKAIQLIQVYANSMADTSSIGFQFKTHLSFAWEYSDNSENMSKSLQETTKDAEQVVVIGYSFPFF